MTTDEKIDEVLRVVREQGERSETRFAQLEAKDNELLSLIREERVLNNSRFTQLATGLMDVRKELSGTKVEIAKMSIDLNTKIDRVYNSLSQDIQVFSEDLHHVERRVTRLEKKALS